MLITHSIAEAVFLSDRVLVMADRPGKIIDEVVIDLPRPRNAATTRAMPKFGEYVAYLGRVMGAANEATSNGPPTPALWTNRRPQASVADGMLTCHRRCWDGSGQTVKIVSVPVNRRPTVPFPIMDGVSCWPKAAPRFSSGAETRGVKAVGKRSVLAMNWLLLPSGARCLLHQVC